MTDIRPTLVTRLDEIDEELASLEDIAHGNIGDRITALRGLVDAALAEAHEVEEMRNEVRRIQQLPELPWAEAGAVIMQAAAQAARSGARLDANAIQDALDKAKVYVSRIRAALSASEQREGQLRDALETVEAIAHNGVYSPDTRLEMVIQAARDVLRPPPPISDR